MITTGGYVFDYRILKGIHEPYKKWSALQLSYIIEYTSLFQGRKAFRRSCWIYLSNIIFFFHKNWQKRTDLLLEEDSFDKDMRRVLRT